MKSATALATLAELTQPVTLGSLALAALVYSGFFFALLAASVILPGEDVLGFPQPDGRRKTYKMNGMSLWVATHMFVITGTLFAGLSLGWLVRHFWSLFIVANAFAAIWSWQLWRPNDRSRWLSELWMGTQLNPTWMNVDLKVFAYQPSLIGLSLINVGFAYVQFERTGSLTPQMLTYQIFWWLYMTTHFVFERGILSMWDVIAEKFGFMLVWGDLVLVTFFYCIGGWYLVDAEPMSWAAVVALCGVHGLGLWIFRGANAQKDRFKRDPNAPIWGRPPEVLGGRLLVSGWWGIGRKLNYTGEIMVYFSFALCTGAASIIPYLLPLWLCVLLPHRAWRDEQRCQQKYGELWAAYCRRAKFRMVPFLY